MGGDRNLAQIRLWHPYSLCRCTLNDHRCHRILPQRSHCFGKQAGELIYRPVENGSHILAIPPHTGGDRIVVAFYTVKYQSFASGQFGADTRKFMYGIHRGLHMG